ncbi:MAG: FmdB family zinc ribbon protein [Labedaea sp.]
MPTYQYACTACDHRFEEVQSFTDPSLTECPECAGRLRKLYGSVGVVFKGSGFYRTDSRTKSTADTGSSDKAGSDKGSSDKAGSDKAGSGKGTSGTTESSSTSGSKPSSTNPSSSTTGTTTPAAKAS